MQLTNLFDENDGSRAVSPVIGVILMVAITVILAAVIGTFVLGLGDNINSTPQVSLDFETSVNTSGGTDQGYINVSHRGGDTIDLDNVEFRIGGTTMSDSAIEPSSGEFQTGSTTTITLGSGTSVAQSDAGGQTLDIVVISEGGGDGSIIGSFDIPDGSVTSS